MKKKYLKRSLIFSFILILVTISMSIGFAAYNINISITGDVHYDPPEAIYVSAVSNKGGTPSMTPTHTINTVTVGNVYTGNATYQYNITFRNHTSTEKKVSAVSGTNSSCTYSLDILNKNIKVDEYKTGVLTLNCSVTSNITSTITFTFADYTIHKLINNSTSATNFLGVSGIANTKVRSLKFGDYETLIDDDDFMETYTRSYNVETSNNAGNGIVAFTTVPDENGMVDVTVGSVDGLVYTGESTNFHGLTNLTSIDFTNLDTKYLTSMNYFLYNAQKLTSLDISGLNTSNVTSFYRGFKNLKKISSITVNGIDTSKVEEFGEAFMNLAQSTSTLNTIDLSNWDVTAALSMNAMFKQVNVKKVLITYWRPIEVTDMSYMFYYSTNLEEVQKGNTYDGSSGVGLPCNKVQNMSYMFYQNNNLYIYPLIINTNNLTDTSYMFGYTRNIDTYNLRYMNTNLVTTMSHMFDHTGGGNIVGDIVLYFTNLSFANCVDTTSMFEYSGIKTVYVSPSFTLTYPSSNVSTSMFHMSSIYGGSGTDCTGASQVTNVISHAKIDGGVSSPGCFTAASN